MSFKEIKIIILLVFLPMLFGFSMVSAQNIPRPTVLVTPTLASIVTPTPAPNKFVVSLTATQDEIIQSLLDQNFIQNKTEFQKIFSKKMGDILPGAYKLTLNMTLAQVSKILHAKPYMKWAVVQPGLRKEEIADILATALGWTKTQKNKWINVYTKTKPEYIEGVYFGDTYLIPITETPQNVAKRLIAKFNENFSQFLPQFSAQNMKWTTGLTLASIVQREAAGIADMPLVAGILFNRLNKSMPLEVDATLQYIRGNKGKGWWAPVSVADKKIVSPYNTYKNVGLPPHPISNPSVDAISAVLNPAKTDCLYYLHDKTGIIHCAVTYAEHLANIDKYLKAN